MNNVMLAGKIVGVRQFEKVVYFTIRTSDGRNKEFIDVTCFDTKFFKRYFCKGMWIGVRGRIHVNKERDYKAEIISEQIFFIGDTKEISNDWTNGQPTEIIEIPTTPLELHATQLNLQTMNLDADETNLPF